MTFYFSRIWMRRFSAYLGIAFVTFALGLYCAVDYFGNAGDRKPAPSGSNDQRIPQVESRLANQKESEQIDAIKKRERWEADRVPIEFRKIDFANFQYSSALGLGSYKLKAGDFEKDIREKSYHLPHNWFASLGAVEYRDFTGDGQKDALVQLVEVVSAGSSTSSVVYKIFRSRGHRPVLLWEISTGSESSCGHKRIVLEAEKIILEVFGACKRPNGPSENYFGDMNTDKFTRFVYRWNGRSFAQEERQVFDFPEDIISNCSDCNTLVDVIETEYREQK